VEDSKFDACPKAGNVANGIEGTHIVSIPHELRKVLLFAVRQKCNPSCFLSVVVLVKSDLTEYLPIRRRLLVEGFS